MERIEPHYPEGWTDLFGSVSDSSFTGADQHSAPKSDRFLIYEICDKKSLSKNAVFKGNDNGTVTHILLVLDLKKMPPVSEKIQFTENSRFFTFAKFER